jgi:hypothetical protein
MGGLFRVLVGLGCCILVAALAQSCSATSDGSKKGGKDESTAGSGGAGGAGFGTGGSGGGCEGSCSSDGKQAFACDGSVDTCDSSELCAYGRCLPACEASEALKSSVGCRYHAVMMDGYASAVGGCFTVFVANTFDVPAVLDVSFGGTPIDLGSYAKIPQGTGTALTYGAYDAAAGLSPGGMAILFLANFGGVTCPVPAAMGSGAQIAGTGLGQSFVLESSAPVVAYQMLPYGGGSAAVTGASLLLPTSAWDTNYVAVNAYAHSPLSGRGPSLDIVAEEDGTTVTLLPKVDIVAGGGVSGASANVPVTYDLAAGQVLQITQPAELTGSPIQSNKRIGVWGGHPCLTVPVNYYACDHAEQQIPPVRALGSEHVAVSHRQRSAVAENPPWRIIGVVDGTQLSYEPMPPGADTTVDLGEVIEFTTYEPFVVRSQDIDHPFVLVTYMTGEQTVTEYYGDADFVRIVPAGQYLRRYVFFTDPTYPNTNLVVVRKSDGGSFADVELGCAGVLGGWTPIGSSGLYEYTRIDLISGNFEPQNGCNNGRHEMTSSAPFGLWVWGWGTPEAPGTISVSYGYPAGENVVPVNDVEVPPVPE